MRPERSSYKGKEAFHLPVVAFEVLSTDDIDLQTSKDTISIGREWDAVLTWII